MSHITPMKLSEQQRIDASVISRRMISAKYGDKSEIERELLVSTVQYALAMFPPYDDEDVEAIVRDLEYEVSVRHTKGVAIYNDYDSNPHDWYTKLNLSDSKQLFWNRYEKFLKGKGSLDTKSIQLLSGTTLPNILNCLGNPNEDFDGKRLVRGLIIGDVQSGKTSTYAGLICKVADAGYKVVILLAGITESLRQQTQGRIDEGIVGYTIRKEGKKKIERKVGVGNFQSEIPASSYTTVAQDFTRSSDNIVSSLSQHKSLVLFVVKKNVAVLTKLYKWLYNQNLDSVKGYVDAPLLLIDDEADNASVNTKKPDTDPTRTNKIIRDICGLFKNATYVGFTATPFANIFIDPDSVDSMKQADLFPEDFIYSLPTPSTYIGAKRLYDIEGLNYNNLRFITDIVEPDYTSDEYKIMVKEDIESLNSGPFYYQHKKEWDGTLPDSLREALLCFFLANVLRDLRGQKSSPRSMLINMSRFVKVQQVISEHVEAIYNQIYRIINYDFSAISSNNSNIPLFKELVDLWRKHFSHIKDVPIQRIIGKENLLNAIKDIKIMVVNGSVASKKLDYEANPSLRVIAIGGLALSRGLTLEGLTVSYFYRNTATFDVLMQMGRWFGYRHGYEDVFQVWTSRESAEWYYEISEASEELKSDIEQMFEERLKPKDFGIKVRNNCERLQITASNKMRTASDYFVRLAYYGNIYDTPYLSFNAQHNRINLQQVQSLAQKLFTAGYKYRFADVGRHSDDEVNSSSYHDSRFFENVPKSIVREFLGKIQCSMLNPNFNIEYILAFIDDTDNDGIEDWDIVFEGGNSKKPYSIPELSNIDCISRPLYDHGNAVQISSRRRVLGTREGDFCLSEQDANIARTKCIDNWIYKEKIPAEVAKKKDIPLKAFFQYLPNRKPMLIVMVIDPEIKPEDPTHKYSIGFKKFVEDLGSDQVVAFAIGFPGRQEEEAAKHYKVNKTWMRINGIFEDDVDTENDEEYDG